MTNSLPKIFVAALVLTCGDRILSVYNPNYGCFSVPMTKLRPKEQWFAAAIRLATEYTGRLFRIDTTQYPVVTSNKI